MSNVVYVNFKTKQIEYSEIEQQLIAPSLNMFEHFDEQVQLIKNRYGDKPLPSFIYVQNFRASKFDTYGYGNVHSSIHQYRPKKGERWNKPCPLPADLRAIDAYLKTKKGETVQLGYKSDPFQWLDMKYGNTKATLELANKYGVTLVLNTMSDLVAHDEYFELVVAGGHVVKVMMGYIGETEEESRRNSPGAPSLKRRELAIEKLEAIGAKVERVYKKRKASTKSKHTAGNSFATLKKLV